MSQGYAFFHEYLDTIRRLGDAGEWQKLRTEQSNYLFGYVWPKGQTTVNIEGLNFHRGEDFTLSKVSREDREKLLQFHPGIAEVMGFYIFRDQYESYVDYCYDLGVW